MDAIKVEQKGWARANLPVPVAVAREAVSKLGLRPTEDSLIDAARSAEHPLHDCFSWDDTDAAQRYRQLQARVILRAVQVRYTAPTREPRSARVVATYAPSPAPTPSINTRAPLSAAASSPAEYRERSLREALAQLDRFRVDYGHLAPDLGPVFDAITSVLDATFEEHDESAARPAVDATAAFHAAKRRQAGVLLDLRGSLSLRAIAEELGIGIDVAGSLVRPPEFVERRPGVWSLSERGRMALLGKEAADDD